MKYYHSLSGMTIAIVLSLGKADTCTSSWQKMQFSQANAVRSLGQGYICDHRAEIKRYRKGTCTIQRQLVRLEPVQEVQSWPRIPTLRRYLTLIKERPKKLADISSDETCVKQCSRASEQTDSTCICKSLYSRCSQTNLVVFGISDSLLTGL